MAEKLAKITGNGPPTENTPGAVGQLYVDTNTALRWVCIEAHYEASYKGTREFYDWKCKGLDPEFIADGLDEEGEDSNSLPFKLNILETICEGVKLTDDSPSYTFDTAITLDTDGLYLLNYTFEGESSNDICGLAFVRDGVVRWGTAQEGDSVTLSSTEVTDTWRSSGVTATLSIYKVEKVITDVVQNAGLSIEGYNTVASGCDAHAEGRETIAAGMYSHAEGTGSEALGDHTHAEGFNTIANGKYQHVQGKYNVVDEEDEYAHIVGNGTSASVRSNAHTVDWDGNAWYAGDVYVGGENEESGAKLATVDEIPEVEKPKAKLVTLSASGWDADTNTQTVEVAGVIGNEAAQLVMPCPAMSSIVAYNKAGILLTAQAADSVTFTAETILTEDINVWIVIEDVEVTRVPAYLTFTSPETFSISIENVTSSAPTLEYSTDANTWAAWNGDSISAVSNGDAYALYLRGTGNTSMGCASTFLIETLEYLYENNWTLTGSNVACVGNIEALLDYETVELGMHPVMDWGCFKQLFKNWTGLIAPPSLPATTLAEECYYGMFYGCTSIKLSETQNDEYTQEYRIPASGTGVTARSALGDMFYNTGGTFTGTPTINTTYYLHKDCSVV